jgi:hypothetical protein
LCTYLPYHSIGDDGALRHKVQEALAVYDEYVKQKPGDEEPTKNGTSGEGEKAEGA